ncbi:MAG: hypothetical protein LBD35_03615 [Prevotellaceae bacterium]|jgi:hypothetical protein|nr:hypothetical protein [Prevotellaceae bacterium]
MEYILIFFILTACFLKLSFRNMQQSVIFALLCAVFVVWSSRWAVAQSKTQLSELLDNPTAMQNAAVLITAESAICFAFCFRELRARFSAKKRSLTETLLRLYPGLLLFPVLFYLHTQLIFAMPGSNFTLLSHAFAGVVALALPLLSFLVKRLWREREARLEIYFIVCLFVCIVGLIATVNGNTTYSAVKTQVNIKALLLSVGLCILLFLLGVLTSRYKWTFKNRINKNGTDI